MPAISFPVVVDFESFGGACREKENAGGTRLIYYWQRGGEVIYMLFIYAKSRQEDLTPAQLRTLNKLVKENLK